MTRAKPSFATDTRGSLFIEKLALIALFCLVVGGVMLQVGDQIFSTFRSGAETVEASYVGPSSSGPLAGAADNLLPSWPSLPTSL